MEVDRNHPEQNGNDGSAEEIVEEETEETLVYVNFEDLHDDLPNADLINFQALGLDSDEPIVQIGDKTYGGNWNEVVGTAVFFEETAVTPKRCYFSPDVPQPLKYTTKTQKCLNLKRIFITPKEETSNAKQNCDDALVTDSPNVIEDSNIEDIKGD